MFCKWVPCRSRDTTSYVSRKPSENGEESARVFSCRLTEPCYVKGEHCSESFSWSPCLIPTSFTVYLGDTEKSSHCVTQDMILLDHIEIFRFECECARFSPSLVTKDWLE